MGILTYQGTQFYLDGEPFVVISGTMHYFRIPRAYWHDRLLKLKECGFNTVVLDIRDGVQYDSHPEISA